MRRRFIRQVRLPLEWCASHFKCCVKWTGVILIAIISSLWIISGYWDISFQIRSVVFTAQTGDFYCIALIRHVKANNPEILKSYYSKLGAPAPSQVFIRRLHNAPKFFGSRAIAKLEVVNWPPIPCMNDQVYLSATGINVSIPFWNLLIVLVPVTVFLFRYGNRKAPRGHCNRCGYNLHGNVGGVCPECGRLISDKQQKQSQNIAANASAS